MPFYGTPVPVMLRELTQAQILACGNFSLIETLTDKIAKEKLKSNIDLIQILEYADRMHEVCKRSMVRPTYEEVMKIVTSRAPEDAHSQLDAIREKIKEVPKGPERDELNRQYDEMRLWVDLMLPEDFTGAIVAYALGVDKSDIRELSEDTLIQSAILAEHGHDNPADHIGGKFTPFMKDDINMRAWMLLHEERKKKKAMGHDGG